jgi:hypothetical protein
MQTVLDEVASSVGVFSAAHNTTIPAPWTPEATAMLNLHLPPLI